MADYLASGAMVEQMMAPLAEAAAARDWTSRRCGRP